MFSILQLDIAGNPSDWISHRQAIAMQFCDRVIANLGEHEFVFKGGHNRISGLRSEVTVSSTVVTKERVMNKRLSRDYAPPYSHKGLFARDRYMCLYCGETFSPSQLTRDHIIIQIITTVCGWVKRSLSEFSKSRQCVIKLIRSSCR